MIDTIYALVNIQQLPSKKSNGFYWTAMWKDITSNKFYSSVIDPNMKNFDRWTSVIANEGKGVLITNCSTIEKNGRVLLDADSTPEILRVCEWHDLSDTIAEFIEKQTID